MMASLDIIIKINKEDLCERQTGIAVKSEAVLSRHGLDRWERRTGAWVFLPESLRQYANSEMRNHREKLGYWNRGPDDGRKDFLLNGR